MLITEKVFRFGAISFVISGLLFAGYFVLSSFIPGPPYQGTQILNWVNEWHVFFAVGDELLFFATLFFLLSICILTKILHADQSLLLMSGCAMIQFLVVPVLVMIVLLQGRLAYPFHNLQLSADVVSFIVSLSMGAMHAVSILLAISILLLSLSLRKILPVFIGCVASVVQLPGAYPWLISLKLNLLCQLTFPIWLFMMGVLLLIKRNNLTLCKM